MTADWILVSLARVQDRLERDGAADSLRALAGMSDPELLVMARAEAASGPPVPACSVPSLGFLLSRGRAEVGLA